MARTKQTYRRPTPVKKDDDTGPAIAVDEIEQRQDEVPENHIVFPPLESLRDELTRAKKRVRDLESDIEAHPATAEERKRRRILPDLTELLPASLHRLLVEQDLNDPLEAFNVYLTQGNDETVIWHCDIRFAKSGLSYHTNNGFTHSKTFICPHWVNNGSAVDAYSFFISVNNGWKDRALAALASYIYRNTKEVKSIANYFGE